MQADLEELARRTWHRTQWGWALKCPQGEETFTDTNLLDLMQWSTRHRVFKTSKQDEKNKGTDWEWIIRHRGVWRRFAVQAKKVSPNGRYDALHHPVKGSRFTSPALVMPQIDVLDLYSKLTGATPLYVLFNYNRAVNATTWHCNLSLSAEQLGCSVTDIATIRAALGTHGGRFFTPVHRAGAVPWRCLVCHCHNRPAQLSSLTADRASEVRDEEVKGMLTTGVSASTRRILNLTARELVDTLMEMTREGLPVLGGGTEEDQVDQRDLVDEVRADPDRFRENELFLNRMKRILLPKYSVLSNGDDEEAFPIEPGLLQQARREKI